MNKSVALMSGELDITPLRPAMEVLDAVGGIEFRIGSIVGEAAAETLADALPQGSVRHARASDAILLGPLGSGEWESPNTSSPKAESVVKGLQHAIGAHVVVEPVIAFESALELSPLRRERIEGTDLTVVHAIGDFYRGEQGMKGEKAWDEGAYSIPEIEDVARAAFDFARRRGEAGRNAQVTSVDKANVLETSRLWRETITALQSSEYPDIELEHMLIDNADAELTANPNRFGVIVTGHMFGDILSGTAAGLTDPRLVPSAHIARDRRGIFRPARPEGRRSTVATILSAAEVLEHALEKPVMATKVREAVFATLNEGIMVPDDLGGAAYKWEFTEAVIDKLPAREAE